MSDARPIGVFDSGLGGMTVLHALVEGLPNERFVYLGDTARVPYGNKSAAIVTQYAIECAQFLVQQDVKLIVAACNTASAVALDGVRGAVGVPVVGVIHPAAEAALAATRNRRLGIIGTRGTIASRAYERAIRASGGAPACQLWSRACPLFVPLVEEGLVDHPATRMIAEEYLLPLREFGVDTLVLGCTHYPLLRSVIAEVLPRVHLVDCGASATAEVLRARGVTFQTAPPGAGTVAYNLTDPSATFAAVVERLLGLPVYEPTVVRVG